MGINFYEKAVSIVGDLPPQFEFIYAFVTIVLILIVIYGLITPLNILNYIFKNHNK